jgi:oligoribonuclease
VTASVVPHRFVWLDVETTGLDENDPEARLLELGLVFAADAPGDDLSVVDEYRFVFHCPKPPPTTKSVVVGMHTRNGLWAECAASDLTYDDADAIIPEILASTGPHGNVVRGSLVAAGNSVHFDLRWLRRFLPKTADLFSHRVCDVSSTTMLQLAAWCPGYRKPPKGEAHRALDDVRESLRIMKYCREFLKCS